MPLTEVDLVAALLSHRAGYVVDLFGGLLYARSLEDGTFAVGSDLEGWEDVVLSARSAAERLVAERVRRGLGLDVEADAGVDDPNDGLDADLLDEALADSSPAFAVRLGEPGHRPPEAPKPRG